MSALASIMLEFVSAMALALALGFKHSFDADHLIAVSGFLRKADKLKKSVSIGMSWVLGHMITASAITVILFIFGRNFLKTALPHFEEIVGLMLVLIGILALKDFLKFHSHIHSHGNFVHSHAHIHAKSHENHSHNHMFGIGIVHGLAGNDELLILFTSSLAVTSIGMLIATLGIFSIGVMVGMVLFSFIFSYPLIKIHSEKLYKLVCLGTGSIGIIYGLFILI